MRILVNGDWRETALPPMWLRLFFAGFGLPRCDRRDRAERGIRTDRDTTQPSSGFREGDRLEVLAPMQGG